MSFVREEVLWVLLNGISLNIVMRFADRSGIGRAQIWEDAAESLLTTLCQWHPDLQGGYKGRGRILNILHFQLIHSCWGAGWEGAALPMVRCALSSVVCGPAQTGSKCQTAPPAAGRDARLLSRGTGLLSMHLHWARSSGWRSFSTKLKLLSGVQYSPDAAKLWVFSSANVSDT